MTYRVRSFPRGAVQLVGPTKRPVTLYDRDVWFSLRQLRVSANAAVTHNRLSPDQFVAIIRAIDDFQQPWRPVSPGVTVSLTLLALVLGFLSGLGIS